MPSRLEFSAREAGLSRAVRNLKGQFQSGNQAMLRVNQRSVKYLKEASAGILDAKANRRDRDERNVVGLRVVEQDDAHEATQDRFGFWVLDRIDRIDARVGSYYRAIDRGSNYWVKRTEDGTAWAALFFVGEPQGPTRGIGTQAAFGDPKGARVRITKPVPRYAFLSKPVRDFRRGGLYAQYVEAEFKAVGLRPTLTRTP